MTYESSNEETGVKMPVNRIMHLIWVYYSYLIIFASLVLVAMIAFDIWGWW